MERQRERERDGEREIGGETERETNLQQTSARAGEWATVISTMASIRDR